MNKMYRKFVERASSIWQAHDEIVWGGALGGEYLDAWVHDIFLDEGGVYAILSSEGKLYRTYITYSDNKLSYSEPQEIVVQHVPIESRTRIFRVNGELRFVSIASAAVLNRSGEIDTMDLYNSMIENWGEYEIVPRLNFYHVQEDDFAMGEVKGIQRYNEFLIAWGVIDESTPIGRNAENTLTDDSWGLSIEFIPLDSEVENISGANIRKYTKGVFVGLAVLKEKHAASYFTKILV